jgi:hypothetical protein
MYWPSLTPLNRSQLGLVNGDVAICDEVRDIRPGARLRLPGSPTQCFFRFLYVEVKGLSGGIIGVEMTRLEYEMMCKHRSHTGSASSLKRWRRDRELSMCSRTFQQRANGSMAMIGQFRSRRLHRHGFAVNELGSLFAPTVHVLAVDKCRPTWPIRIE